MTEYQVTEAGAEMRLDRYLRREVPGLTQGVLQKLLRTGKVRLDGQPRRRQCPPCAGRQLSVPEIAHPPKRPSSAMS